MILPQVCFVQGAQHALNGETAQPTQRRHLSATRQNEEGPKEYGGDSTRVGRAKTRQAGVARPGIVARRQRRHLNHELRIVYISIQQLYKSSDLLRRPYSSLSGTIILYNRGGALSPGRRDPLYTVGSLVE